MCDVCVDFLSLLVACRSQNILFFYNIYFDVYVCSTYGALSSFLICSCRRGENIQNDIIKSNCLCFWMNMMHRSRWKNGQNHVLQIGYSVFFLCSVGENAMRIEKSFRAFFFLLPWLMWKVVDCSLSRILAMYICVRKYCICGANARLTCIQKIG